MRELRGIIPALVTPYDDDGVIDARLAARLVEHLLGQGVGGFYLGGTTGEGPLQSPRERVDFAAAVVDAVEGRVPVVAHVGTPDTATSVALARDAAAAGVSAVSAVAPYYYRHGAEQVRRHFLDLADSSPVPFVPYHLAAGSETAPTLEFLVELAQHPNVVAMKYTSRDVYELQQLVASTRGRMVVFNGADEVLVHGIVAGAVGGIGSTYNFMAATFVQAYAALERGDIRAAAQLQAQANAVIREGAAYDNVAFAREVVRAQGFDVGPPRKPIEQLGERDRAFVADLVRRTPILAGR